MEERETVCRLCLKDCNNNFTVLDENATEFVAFLLKCNLVVNEGALICANCAKSIKDCSNFKSKCLDVEDFILQRINHMLDINDILDHDVCRLCMCSLRLDSSIFLDNKVGDTMLETIMLEKCLPELDFRITEKPVICSPCRESLQHYFGFITNCRNVEEKIKKYCEAAGVDSTGLIKLTDVIEFMVEPEYIKVDRIKVEDKFCGDEGLVDEKKFNEETQCALENVSMKKVGQELKLEEEIFLEDIDCEIKLESENLKEMDEQQFENMDDQEHLNRFKVDIDLSPLEAPNLLEHEDPLEVNKYKCDYCSYKSKFKCTLDRHLLKHKDSSEVTVHKCVYCLYQTIHKYDLSKHLLKHKDFSEVTVHKCGFCSFQTRYKDCLKRHLLKHKKEKCLNPNLQGDLSTKPPSQMTLINKNATSTIIYQCDLCPYLTKMKGHLKDHLLLHKDPSEVTMYKCGSCLYKTKYKKDLKRHLLRHKNPSEVTMYKCDSCSYQTKHESYLREHSLRHRYPSEVTPSEVKMHKCDSCSYQTKQKGNLNKHVLVKHGDPSKVDVFKCNSCSYQSKFKCALNTHLLKHKDPSEVTVYKCDVCSYKTTHKYSLNEHLLIHKEPSEVPMYKCDFCSFETKYKKCINRHLLRRHRKQECLKPNLEGDLSSGSPSQMTPTDKKVTTTIRYQCDFCDYQATKKCHLRDHLLLHKDPSEVTMYKCGSCSYETKYKKGLNNHLLKHKDPSEVTMYKCEICLFQTKSKSYLKTHSLTHQDPSAVIMYKCDFCTFQTKRKYYIKKHLKLHRDL